MATSIKFDSSYKILEYEIDPSWKKHVSDEYRQYRERWKMASRGKLFEFPLCVEIESSYYCNLKCPKCVRQVLGISEEEGFMEQELYAKLLGEAKAHKMPAIMLDHEAEPLTSPHITDMAREAKKAGMVDIWLHTNGNLLTEDISERLIRSGLTKMNFSIDAATPQTYATVRPGGNYDKVIKNIITFLELKEKLKKHYLRTRVSFVMQEENMQEREAFFEFWKDKVNVISFQYLIDFSKFKNRLERLPECPDDFSCYKPWQLLIVRYNGDVIPCGMPFRHYRERDYLLGNLRSATIKECWNSEKMRKIRKSILGKKYQTLPFCRDCVSAYAAGV